MRRVVMGAKRSIEEDTTKKNEGILPRVDEEKDTIGKVR